MSQYSQRYWQYSLVTVLVMVLLQGCSSVGVSAGAAVEVPVAAEGVLPQEAAVSSLEGVVSGSEESLSADPFEGIYSSFSDEMTLADGGATDSEKSSPLTFLAEINGGRDALTAAIPTWVTGEQFTRFLEPVAFTLHDEALYILDSGRQAMFRYNADENIIITIFDFSQYLRGTPAGLVFSDDGYYFISDPKLNRVLKFNAENILIAVYEDIANLASPGKLYFDNKYNKLYISDGVYSRILVASKHGDFLYALGGRGTDPGQFISITDFVSTETGIYVIDRIAKEPMQVLNHEGDYLRAYGSSSLSIPVAIAVDERGYVYVADNEDDTIRIFVDGVLRWRVGGSGIQQGYFRKVTQMMVSDDKLYVLDSLNRRIQVFQINN